MDAIHRQALMFVRLTAACLVLIGFLDTGLYVAQCFRSEKSGPDVQANNSPSGLQLKQVAPIRVLPIVLNSIPLVVGAVGLIKARSVAGWITEKLE